MVPSKWCSQLALTSPSLPNHKVDGRLLESHASSSGFLKTTPPIDEVLAC